MESFGVLSNAGGSGSPLGPGGDARAFENGKPKRKRKQLSAAWIKGLATAAGTILMVLGCAVSWFFGVVVGKRGLVRGIFLLMWEGPCFFLVVDGDSYHGLDAERASEFEYAKGGGVVSGCCLWCSVGASWYVVSEFSTFFL